jgi:hypothetical protein
MLLTESRGPKDNGLKLPNTRVSVVAEQAALTSFGKAQSNSPAIANSLHDAVIASRPRM